MMIKYCVYCGSNFLPENDSSFKQFFTSHLEQSMKYRSLKIKPNTDVTLEYSSNATGMLHKTVFRCWFLRKVTGISDHIRFSLNRIYAIVMLNLYKSGSNCHELFII